MSTRSELVADDAVTVLARDGLRGLTHRGVDAQAGLPTGSTSNCFRSRTALIEAIVARLEELDREALTTGPPPSSGCCAEGSARPAVPEVMDAPRRTRARRPESWARRQAARPASGHGKCLSSFALTMAIPDES